MMKHTRVTILCLVWPALAVCQSMHSMAIQPLAQLPGDNLNPDFSESEAFSYFPPGEKWWLAWDVGTAEIRNIYVKSRVIEGEAWSNEFAVTAETFINQNPDIESFGDSALIVWESNKRGNFDILYSVFDGNAWTEPQFVTQDSVDNRNPVLHTYRLIGQNAFAALLVWERKHALYWSKFEGNNWSTPALFPSGNDSAKAPNFGREHSLPFLLWEGLQDGNWDIYCSWFMPDSNHWAPEVRLTSDPAEDRHPQAGFIEIYYVPVTQSFTGWSSIVWQTNRDANWEIYSGTYWLSDGPPLVNVKNLSAHESSDVEPAARLTVHGDVFFVVSAWQSDRTGENAIFTNDINVHLDSTLGRRPRYSRFIKLQYWLAWESHQNDHWEIWGRRIQGAIDGVKLPARERVPGAFELAQNYPNPFKNATIIPVTLLQSASVELEVFDLQGQKVKTLLAGRVPAGKYDVAWNGSNELGVLVQSGVYFIRLIIGKQSMIRKVIFLR